MTERFCRGGDGLAFARAAAVVRAAPAVDQRMHPQASSAPGTGRSRTRRRARKPRPETGPRPSNAGLRGGWVGLGRRRILAQGARDHEADSGALAVDRAGLVVDHADPLGDGDDLHLVEVAVVAALAGDHPEVARLLDPRAVADEGLLGLVERLDEDYRAVELPGADQAAADRGLDAVAHSRTDVADDLDPLALLDAELLDGAAVAVVALRHLRPSIVTFPTDGGTGLQASCRSQARAVRW